MKRSRLLALIGFLGAASFLIAQAPVSSQNQAPSSAVSYASMSEVNSLLTQVDQVSQTITADLGKLRIEKWKTDNDYKRQSLTNSDSIQRNLQTAMPGMVNQLRSAPDSLTATFKLYRNAGALYDVLASLTESAGAFGSKEEFQMLANDSSALDQARRGLADRMDKLASSKEEELSNLRVQVRNLQAAVPPPPPKKIIIDEEEKPKKAAKKKAPPAKPAATITPAKPQ